MTHQQLTPGLEVLVVGAEQQPPVRLGEGPTWHTERGILYWIDIKGAALHIYHPETQKDKRLPVPNGQVIGAAIPCEGKKEKLVVPLQNGIHLWDIEEGHLRLITDPEEDKPNNRFNDAKCDPRGRLIAGTMDNAEEKEDNASLYLLRSATSQCEVLIPKVSLSNGIGFSPKRDKMYYIDSPKHEVYSFDYNEETGHLSNRKVLTRIEPSFPDGMDVDSEGKLWIAQWGGGCVSRHDPDTGAEISRVTLPVSQVSSCCFGGKNMDELYITTAAVNIDPHKEPLAGSLFVFRESQTRGLPHFQFKEHDCDLHYPCFLCGGEGCSFLAAHTVRGRPCVTLHLSIPRLLRIFSIEVVPEAKVRVNSSYCAAKRSPRVHFFRSGGMGSSVSYLLLFVALVLLDGVDGQTQAQQRSDLMLLYNSAGGSSWTSKTNWGGSNPCNFYGVTCDGSGNVVTLRLENIGMQGTIPSGFGQNLGYMQTLAITGHYAVSGGTKGVYGPLPSSFTSMGNLQYFYINSNELSGTLPNFSAFPKLIYVMSPRIMLSEIPQADFEYNRFTGFSNPSGLTSVTQLKRLWLYRNNFASIPSDVTSMSSVTSIRAECNYLTSSVPSGIWSMPNVNELSFGFQVRGDQYAVYNPTGNRVPGIVPKSISTKTLLDLSGNAFDEFEDYTMGSPLGSGATCDMSSKGSPSGPNFACPIPAWASSSCSATCTCYQPTTSSVSGNPPNAGGDIVITGRYWGTQRNAKCDSGWKDMHIQVIDSHDHHLYSPCMSEYTEHRKCSGQVRILHLHVERSYNDIPGTHDIVDNVFNDIVDNIIYNIFYHINNEGDDIHNVDNQADHVDDIVYHVDNIIYQVDNIIYHVDDKADDLYNIVHYVDNEANDINYVDNEANGIDDPTTSTTKPTTSTTSTTKATTSTSSTTKPTTSTTSTTKPLTSTKSSTTSSIPSTSSTTIATTTDIPFCDQIFLSFNRSLSSSVLQDQLRGIQPLAMQCPEQLNAVVLQIASTNLQRNKTFVVEAGNISIAAGKIKNGTQMNLVFSSSAASGLIPSDVADLLPVNSSAILSFYAFNPYVISSTDSVQYTNLVSLSVISPNGTEIHVHNTSSAIEIGMDYNAVDGYEIECVWWDNSTRGWNREGCMTDTSSQPVKCLCSHLTSFSLQLTPKEVPPSDIVAKPFPWKWVGIGAGGFVFLLAVALVVIIIVARRRKWKTNDNEFAMKPSSSTAPHVIPADQILPEGYLSPRVRKARYQLSNVIVVRAQAGDGLSDQLLQRLKHINIAQYLGCYVDTVGDTYFVTYYAPGTKMTEWIGMGNYDNETAHQTVLQLANVMAYLFDQNVNDYRLTADKIIVQPDTGGHMLKLWDFRLGSKLPKLYTPPEKKMRTEAALVWAFGVLSQQIIDKQLYTPNTPYTEYYNGEDIPESSVEFSVKQRCVQTSEKKKRVTRDSLRKDPTKRPTFVELCRRGKEIASSTSFNGSSISFPAQQRRFPSVYQKQTSDPYSQIHI
ncbi:hypothetical protein PROFUN_13773 [Planoprotostelium fungivorum]|uniref:Gluconolactonase n=1 Tax=Planoprotostelium fungivorum TaxID=1890364 RepID=A0A2P6N266_9EUKA|nr:hypothetical protein PROFUN_13773 [Planoprotostelium fungivorum]